MSGDDGSTVLVDQNMNMVSQVRMGRTDRHHDQGDLIQSDKITKHMQQDLNNGLLKDLTGLKSPLANGSSDILGGGDVGASAKFNPNLPKTEVVTGESTQPPFKFDQELEEEEKEANLCESEADDRHDQGRLWSVQRRVCLVKLYAWIKEEMSKTSARAVAGHLYQHERRLLSHADHESILHCSWRREAVEQLLKKVLMGPSDIYEVFLRSLKDQEESHIAAKLVNTHASEKEVELFTTLESASLQQCPRPDSDLPRFHVSNSDHETLLYYLNNKNTINSLSDNLLSRFLFSIREHTNICQCSLDCERRVRLLLETLRECADCVFKDFCEILVAIEMEHVLKKLERRKQGEVSCRQRQKRKVDTSQADTSYEPASASTSAKRLCVDSSMEHRLVSSMQRSSSNLRLHAIDQFGFDVENVNKGSIVIQLCPRMADSWSRLEENCRSGRIKDFIPVVYNNEAVTDLLQEGEYKLQFTIYTLPTPPDSQGDKKVMFHLETEPEKPKESPQDSDNPIEDHIDLLCEELEISRDLLALLKREKLVGPSIKEDIDKQGARAKKIRFLLKEVGKHGKRGYEVLKQHIKEDNEDLYKELTTRDEVKVIDSKMDVAAKVNKRSKPPGNHRGKKEVFFSGVVVLKVKRTGSTPSKENVNPQVGKDQLEISCPEIINPVCHFSKDKGKAPSSGEVTMVLEEAWSAVGDKPKQREILVGKRKKRGSTGKEDVSCKRTESEEKSDEETEAAPETDLKAKDEAEVKEEQPEEANKNKSKDKEKK